MIKRHFDCRRITARNHGALPSNDRRRAPSLDGRTWEWFPPGFVYCQTGYPRENRSHIELARVERVDQVARRIGFHGSVEILFIRELFTLIHRTLYVRICHTEE
jgi:hypothetical protein